MSRFGVSRLPKMNFISVLMISLGVALGGMTAGSAPARADSFGFGIDSDGDVSVYFHARDDRKRHKKHRRYRNDYYKGDRYGYRRHYYDRGRYSHHNRGTSFSFSFGVPRRSHRHYHDHNHYREPWRADCHRVSKRGYWHGAPAKIGGTMCYDRYGRSYIVPGSRRLLHYY